MSQSLSSSQSGVAPSYAFNTQLWALALLNGANLFGFIAYHKVQPTVLNLFEFGNLALFLAAIQAFIGLVMNPLMGYIADKHRTLTNKAFNLIGIGVNFAGVVFITVAIGATASSNATIHGILQPIVPVLVILWLVAMAVFNSPAMSLIAAFAPPEKTMQAYVAFAVIDIALYAFTPQIEAIVEMMPLGLVFFLGGLVLWGAYRLLRRLTPVIPSTRPESRTPRLAFNLFVLLMVGILITTASRLPLAAVPIFLSEGFARMGITDMMPVMFAVFGLSIALSIPLGNRFEKANAYVLAGALLSAPLIAWLAYALPHPAVAIVCALALSLCSVLLKLNSIPFVFNRVKVRDAGLGIGFYFAGASLATLGIFLMLLGYEGQLGNWIQAHFGSN